MRSVTNIFYTLQYFSAPGGPSGPKFTNPGNDVRQGPLYQSAKFRPLLTTGLWDICCRSLLISLNVWLTDRQKTSASVKEWCMSPHGITGPLDRNEPNLGNKCRLARSLTLPNFVMRWRKSVLPQKWTRSSPK